MNFAVIRVPPKTHAKAAKLAKSLKTRRIDMVYEAAMDLFARLPTQTQREAVMGDPSPAKEPPAST